MKNTANDKMNKMMQIIESLLFMNRTIVSSDMEQCISSLKNEVPLTIHRYASGKEYGTWMIPPQWDVKKAELSDGNTIIASYDDHPLFLAPYSCSFTGWIDRDELLKHVRSASHQPDAFSYDHRLAYDFQRRLNEWAITLPNSLVQELDKEKYYIDIQVNTQPGELLIGESMIKGQNDYTFAFLTHLCHPGQANDGLAGVAVGVEVMKRIRDEFETPNFNYQLLIMPETIGSAVYLASNPDRIDSYLGSIFIEMPGIRSPISIKKTYRGNTYLDRILRQVVMDRKIDFSECDFRKPWGNDELIFDSPGVGIPSAAIQRYPFDAYHTSADDLAATDQLNLDEIVEILLETVRVIESDFIPVPQQRVPVYLTRYNLYADAKTERSQYFLNVSILDALWEGKSVFDIAQKLKIPYSKVKDFVARLQDHELVKQIRLEPKYFRQSLEEISDH